MTEHINYHFLNSINAFKQSSQLALKEAADHCLKKINNIIPINSIDIIFQNDPSKTIPEYGLGGFSPNANTLFLYFDVYENPINQQVIKRMKKMLAHEANHCLRYMGPGFGKTLKEQIVTEGIADHFSLEIMGGGIPMWCKAISKESIGYWLQEIYKVQNDEDSYMEWFHGYKKTRKKWIGYSIGYHLIEEYLHKNPNVKPSQLTFIGADSILDQVW